MSPRLLRIILRNGTHQPIGVGRDLHALGPAAGKPAQPLVDVPFSSSRLARWLLRSARSSLRSVTWPLRDTVSDLPRGAGAWVEGVASADAYHCIKRKGFSPYPPTVARCETSFSITRITTNFSTQPTPSRRVPSGALLGTWQHLHPRTGWLPSSFCFHPAAFDQLPKPAVTRYGPASVAGGGKKRRKLAGIARPPRPVVEETTTRPFRAPSPRVVASLNSD